MGDEVCHVCSEGDGIRCGGAAHGGRLTPAWERGRDKVDIIFDQGLWQSGGVTDAESTVKEEDERGTGGVSVVGVCEGTAVWKYEGLVLDVDHDGGKDRMKT